MVRPPDSWRFSLSAFPIPENPLPTPSAGVRMTAHIRSSLSARGQQGRNSTSPTRFSLPSPPSVEKAPRLTAGSHRKVGQSRTRLQDRVDGLFQAALIEGLAQDGAILEVLDHSG